MTGSNTIIAKLLESNPGVIFSLMKLHNSIKGRVITNTILASISLASTEMTPTLDPIAPTKTRIDSINTWGEIISIFIMYYSNNNF